MVSHGVLSWISPDNRRHLVGTVAKRLKPADWSTGVETGWTSMMQALMRMLAGASPERSDVAAPGVLDFVDRLLAVVLLSGTTAYAEEATIYGGIAPVASDFRRVP